MTFTFRWESSYMDVVEYSVFGDGNPYRASLRRAAGDYEKSIYNHASPLADWEHDVVASICCIATTLGSRSRSRWSTRSTAG